MAFIVENPTIENLLAVVQFLAAQGHQPIDIYQRMKAVYGVSCCSQDTVVDWCNKFKQEQITTKKLSPTKRALDEVTARDNNSGG